MDQKPSRLKLSPEDLEKIRQAKERAEGNTKSDVDPEWLAIAEFGTYYGWSAVEAVLSNSIDPDTFTVLLHAGRKVWYGKVVDLANVDFIASVSAASAKPAANFQKLIKNYQKQAEVSR
ncbi:hypothetical protein [Streptomyces sp. BBFR109]|uniref:hypothetical protein n=1 Tax=Streptomyces sp. BBFR109 TaxID=3448172 RepID=UPI003F75E08A